MRIEIAINTPRAIDFALWLLERNQFASIGNTNNSLIDGIIENEKVEAIRRYYINNTSSMEI